jgi:hypothetical protein
VELHFGIRCTETGPRGCHDNVRYKSVLRHYRQLVGLSLHTLLSASACCLGILALSLLRCANYNLILSLGGCNRRNCARACVRLCLGSCKQEASKYDPLFAIILSIYRKGFFRRNGGIEARKACVENDKLR